ncbi:unnamed protein product [Zymoseptoria tritici ST99CH_1E4]|uniref:Uncharacterized protein n=1 Tax=Zymoseptoria tritici ST99CH_1E4 TaxID=1276532 RepID=A0A2H1G4I7_ZYMTR|nr:unnamed protein product [Zymoseptoria tritici ST99CH_1E4]
MSSFLDMATELRCEVYELLSHDQESNHTSLLLVCHQINSEAHAILMKGATLTITYDLTPGSESSTSIKARWNDLLPETRSNIAGIHFEVDHTESLSIASIAQLMLTLCEVGNFSGRRKSFKLNAVPETVYDAPADIAGDLDITFSISKLNPIDTESSRHSRNGWLVEFFFLVLYTAMELEETGPKDMEEVKEEVMRILGYDGDIYEAFKVGAHWVHSMWLPSADRTVLWYRLVGTWS